MHLSGRPKHAPQRSPLLPSSKHFRSFALFYLRRPRKIGRSSAAEHLRYATHDGRHLLVGTVGIGSREDFHDLIRAETHPKAFASFLLADFTTGAPSTYTTARNVASVLADSTTCSKAIFVVHGPPSEPVNVHAHVLVHAPGVRDRDIRADLLATLDNHGLLITLDGHGYKDYRKLEREDVYSFGEWLERCGFLDTVLAAHDPQAIANTLRRFGIRRTPYNDGFTLVDATATDGIAVKASRFGLSESQLLTRFGSASLPPSDAAISRSYTTERHTKYPASLHDLHHAARNAWHADVAPLVEAGRQAVFAHSRERNGRREKTAKRLLDRVELPPTATNISAARNLVKRDTRRMVERRLREIDETHPPAPAARIGDWLRQLYVESPLPVASAPGSALVAREGQRLVEGIDVELYDEHGIIVAHEDARGVELRTLEADVALRHATTIVAHHNVEPDDLPERLRSLELRFAPTPPAPPAAVQEAIDAAAAHQLDRAIFAPTPPDRDDPAGRDDRQERDLDLPRQRRRRGATRDQRKRRR